MIDLASSIVKIQYSKENTEPVGAGFFITSAGHILTCQHVIDNVEDENEIWVSWIKLTEPVKTEYCKNLSDTSDKRDFAILKVSLSQNSHIKLPPKLDIGVDCNPEETITGKGFQSSKFDLYPASGVILGDTIRKKDGCRFWVLKEAKYVDKGISGSPAINTKTNKVIGIFTEQELKKEQLSEFGITAIMDKSALVTPIDEIAKELHLRNIKEPDISRFINSILFEPFENKNEFESDTKEILNMMDYEIEDEPISGIIRATPPTFIASQEGDFETNRTLFQCIYGMTDENAVIGFHSIYHLNQVSLKLKYAVIITNTFISPSVKLLAAQYQIKLLSSHDLLNSVMKINRYLKSKCKEYIQNNKLFYTYVEIKYIRKGKGNYKEATPNEFLISESPDKKSFEAKGELTPYIDKWLSEENNAQICLLGDYGTGKTSFANHYFYRQATVYLENPLKNRIPLLVTLNRYHKSADIEQMMTDFLVNECGIKRDFSTFLKIAKRGKLLIILDGFDEMAKQVDVNVRKHNFRQIARLLIGKNKVILSGRPNYFLDRTEIDEIFNQQTENTDPYKGALQKAVSEYNPTYEILNITLFDRWQINEFIEKQSNYLKQHGINDWKELEKTIYNTYNLEELARTPVLLEIILKTLPKICGKISDINAAKLYEIYTGHWLNREYEKGEVRWLINRTDKEFFILELAWQMLMTDNLTPEIHFSSLSETIRNYFKLEKASQIEYFSSDIRSWSFLIHSETDGKYKFIHKSFMEYFSACYIYKALFEEYYPSKIITDKPITDEVFFFLCQMIPLYKTDLLIKFTENSGKKEFIVSFSERLFTKIADMSEYRGNIQESEKCIDKFLQYSEVIESTNGIIKALYYKGNLKLRLGQVNEALSYLENAYKLSLEIKDKRSQGQILTQMGKAYQFVGNINNVIECFEKALYISLELNERYDESQVLMQLGIAYSSMGEYHKAIEYHEKGLMISKEIGNRYDEGLIISELAKIYQSLSEYDKTLEYYQRGLAIFRELGDKSNESKIIANIGNAYYLIGEYDRAKEYYLNALKISEEIGDKQVEIHSLSQIGSIFLQKGEYDRAEKCYLNVLKISEEIGDKQGLIQSLSQIGNIFLQKREYDRAEEYYLHALKISEEIGDRRSVAIILRYIAKIQSDFEKSEKYYTESLIIFEEIADKLSISSILHELGILSQAAMELNKAEVYYKKAFELKKSLGDKKGESDILESFGNLEKARKNFIRAKEYYKSALEISVQIGNRINECQQYVNIGKLAQEEGDKQNVIEYYGKYIKQAKEIGLNLLGDVVMEYDKLISEKRYNPYIAGMPIRDESAFFGRKKELEIIYNYIQNGNHVMIVGDRRMGKTSLLMQLKQRLITPLIAVFIDLQGIASKQTEATLNEFLKIIVHNLSEQDLISSERWKNYSISYANDFIKAIDSILKEANSKYADIKLVLLIDECDMLIGHELEKIGSILRATFTRSQNIIGVLAGTRRFYIPQVPISQVLSPLQNILNSVILEPLSEEDTKELIVKSSVKVGISYEPEAIECIYELCGGIPYICQLICRELIELANDKLKNKITLNDVNNIIPEILSKDYFFRYSWEGLTDEEKNILIALADNKPSTLSKKTIEDLKIKLIIRDDNGKFRFVAKLFEEWCKKYKVETA